MRKMQSH